MSRSFSYILSKISKEFIPEFKIFFSVFGLASHALYSYGTYNTDTIKINTKYKYTKNANTEFMIIDQNGIHYNVTNNFWYWKWNSIEDWNILRENDSIKIKYYGYRIPFLGFFPNIIYNKNICDEDKTIETNDPYLFQLTNNEILDVLHSF